MMSLESKLHKVESEIIGWHMVSVPCMFVE